MKLHDLRPSPGTKKKSKRLGRGISAGGGKTGGRGTKGQNSRSGGGKGPYFEGGNLPLVRRLPFKRGFNNIFRTEYQEVNLEDIADRFEGGEEVSPASLKAKRLIRDAEAAVVLLGRGDLDRKLTVRVHRISKSAKEKIEAAGGTVELLTLELTGARATVKKLRKEQIEALRQKRQE